MPVWNGEVYLRAALESVLAQSLADFELIIVDDGSEDGTVEILQSYKDARLKIHRRPHAGIVSALNFGINQARAEWIARQDADDLSQPERLRRQWEALQENPGAVLCFTGQGIADEGGGEVRTARFPRTRSFLALRLCYQCPITHSTVLFSKAAAEAAGCYREAERHAEDFALWGRMMEAGEFVGLPEKLVTFRRHTGSISQRNLALQDALALRIATEHCRRFMSLEPRKAERAARLLRLGPAQRRLGDWLWFLARCAPRLRWKSWETAGWLGWQTLKLLQPA
ncbi:hypothetical protein BH20VER3_BH20VER3_02580 [soil metagenome]